MSDSKSGGLFQNFAFESAGAIHLVFLAATPQSSLTDTKKLECCSHPLKQG